MSQWEYDAAVIGGGVTGYAVAGELSRYELRACVMERGEDVCSGTSKVNSAIIYTGYGTIPGMRKAGFSVAGNATMEQLSKDLDFPSKRNGSLVLYSAREEELKLEELYERDVASGTPDTRLITGDEARSMEPSLTDEMTAAICTPSGGAICLFGLTIALAENVYENGVEFRLLTEVERIEKVESGRYSLAIRHEGTTKATTAHYVVNAVGAYANTPHNMISSRPIHTMPRKGGYCPLGKEAGSHVTSTMFQLPDIHRKGVLVTLTMHGNLLIDPAATDIEDRENVVTTMGGLTKVISKPVWNMKNIPYRQVITSLTGLRAYEDGDDFAIDEAEGMEGPYDAAGTESPGSSYAPTIEVCLAKLIVGVMVAGRKKQFITCHKEILHLGSMEKEERARLIKECLDYGTIICRCENVSEGGIIDIIRRPLRATLLNGIKRWVRQGMGRRQAGFCTPRIMEILARKPYISIEDVCKSTPSSQMLIGISGEEER